MHDDAALFPILRTVCLLESRSEQYGAYLATVLGEQPWIDAWAAEEATHGARLRDYLAVHDPDFDFDRAFARLADLPYHEDDARPPAEELLSRCVVEALAAGFYRALRDAARTPELQALCATLMRDEVRHYKGFRTHLAARPDLSWPARTRVIARRVRELDDDQIAFAAHCAYGDGDYHHRRSRREYMSRVYALYREEHLAFIQAMLFRALGARPPRRWRWIVRRSLFAAVRLRATHTRLLSGLA
ncbi:MAG: ferritin-like domain-containing protein [Deltaproteobacteria bacterium]|nr:MAG: ferritin-like domain-containing protein [Deltaproteobacteria bacterium]